MADSIDFTAPRVKRGRITNARTSDSMAFALNPSTISVKGGSNVAEDPTPGSSDPLMRWMSGKVRTFSFTLFHDGEINLRVFNAQMSNAAKQVETAPRTWGTGNGRQELVDDPSGYSVAGALEFLDQFCHPVDPTLPRSDGGADRVILNFGSYIRNVVCVMDDVQHEITEWDPELNPVRAKSTLTLKRYVTETTYANKIWSPLAPVNLK